MIVEYATKTVENLVTSDWNAPNPVRPEMSAPDRESLRRSIGQMDAVQGLGFDVQLLEEGVVEIRILKVRSFHRSAGEGGLLNGGILLSLLDSASTAAAMAVLGSDECGTTRLATSFLRPFASPVVTARAWVVETDGGVATTKAIISDEDGPVAVAEAAVVDVQRTHGVMSTAA